MRQVNLTINVSDNKFDLLMEFLKKNFGSVDIHDEFEVPEWHKKIVLERMKNSKPEDFFSLDELDTKIKS